jgi:hypothetical protein
MTEQDATDLYMRRVSDAFNEYYASTNQVSIDPSMMERVAVLALLDRELEIAEVHDLLVGTVRLRQLRDIIERGEHHRKEEKP